MSPISQKVYKAICDAIAADKLILPTMPEMALKVRDAADDPDVDIKKLAGIIGHDAALTARIIKVANSALYRGSQDIQDLNMALMRLGLATTSSLAIGLAMEQMFQATTDMVDKRLRDVWTISSETAGMCTMICKFQTKLRPDMATLAGLTHKIGILPILQFAEHYPALLRDGMTLDSITQEIHSLLGARILTEWDFPAEICNVPLTHVDFTRQADKADYSDIVTVAMLQSLAAGGQRFGDLDYSTVTAFDRLGLNFDIESAIAEGVDEDMAQAMKLLS
ncbi:MAG TPA: HDOD domain-containing protein [Marinagarivorans sp.]